MSITIDIENLHTLSRDWQSLASALDRLQPQRWLETDDTRIARIVEDMTDLRLRQNRLLRDRDAEGILSRLDHAPHDKLSDTDRALIRAMRRICNHTLPLGDNDIRAMERITASSENDWLDSFAIAAAEGNAAGFAALGETLATVFGMRRALVRKIAAAKGIKPSEVAIDEWNPWLRNGDIDALFARAQTLWPTVMKELAAGAQQRPPAEDPFTDPDPAQQRLISDKFAPDRQLAFFTSIRNMLLESAGWTPEALEQAGVTLHDPNFLPNPFCAGTRSEVWMTIENRDGDFFVGLTNTLHETGHLLYLLSENRLPEDIIDTPLGQFNLDLHETAAVFFEHTTADPHFWELAAPLIRDHFGVDGPAWTAENLHRLKNDPVPDDTSWCASEATLLPNMAFRTMAERKILDGLMEVDELPREWAQTMTALTGTAHDPDNFFLDESHWLDRYSGYFPSYWIGALCSARLHDMIAPQTRQTADMAAYLKTSYDHLEQKILRHAARHSALEVSKAELGGAPQDFLDIYIRNLTQSALGPAAAATALSRILNAAPGPAQPQPAPPGASSPGDRRDDAPGTVPPAPPAQPRHPPDPRITG